MNNALVAYYSFSGSTRALAEEIACQTGAHLRELVPQKPYAFDYNTAVKEARNEITRGYCPKLASGNEPIQEYGIIFIGTPNWFKTLAPPVLSFLRQHSFSNKTIVPFCTHGGGGFGNIETRIAEECPASSLLSGLAVSGSPGHRVVSAWLQSIGLHRP